MRTRDQHYYLLLQALEGNPSPDIRHLNSVGSKQFNRQLRRVRDACFRRRFKAIVVERETCLHELACYMVFSTVLAAMVRDAAEYR